MFVVWCRGFHGVPSESMWLDEGREEMFRPAVWVKVTRSMTLPTKLDQVQWNPRIHRQSTGSFFFFENGWECKHPDVVYMFRYLFSKFEFYQWVDRYIFSCWCVSWSLVCSVTVNTPSHQQPGKSVNEMIMCFPPSASHHFGGFFTHVKHHCILPVKSTSSFVNEYLYGSFCPSMWKPVLTKDDIPLNYRLRPIPDWQACVAVLETLVMMMVKVQRTPQSFPGRQKSTVFFWWTPPFWLVKSYTLLPRSSYIHLTIGFYSYFFCVDSTLRCLNSLFNRPRSLFFCREIPKTCCFPFQGEGHGSPGAWVPMCLAGHGI